MTDVGSARVEVQGDVRNFAKQTERDLNAALSKIDLKDVKVDADQAHARTSGETAGRALGDGVTRGADGRLRDSRGKFVSMGESAGRAVGDGAAGGVNKSRGGISGALKKAFTPDASLFAALKAPFAAALSTPVTAAVIAVAAVAAAAFVGAFAATLATAGLGAVFLGIGAAALFGAKKSRDDAEKDLKSAEEKVRKAEQRAQSGTAASKRSLADARAELAKAQVAVGKNESFVKLDTSLKNLGATLKRVAQTAAVPLMKPLIAAFELLGKAAERIGPLLTQIFAGLAPAIGPLTEGMIGFVEEFLKVLTQDPSTLESMRDTLIALGANLPRIGAALGGFFEILASNENNVRNMGLLFGLVETSIQGLGETLYGLSVALDGLIIAWNAVGTAISAAVGWITGTAVPAIVAAAVAVGQFFQSIPGAIASAWAAVVGFFTGVIGSIVGFLASVGAAVIGFFAALPGRIMGAIQALPGILAAFFSGLVSSIAYLIGYGIGLVVGFFAALPGRVMGAIQALPGLVAGVLNSLWNTARSIVSSGVSAVVSFFAQLPGRVRSAISAIVGAVTSVFSSAKSSAVSQSSGLVSGAINIVKALPGKIRSALSSVKSAVLGAFAGAGSWLVGAGRSIISGVVNGIGSAIGGAIAAARSAAARMVQGFKDALKIGSPSKLMNLEVGRMIPAGAAEGINDNAGVVDKAIRDMIGRTSLAGLPVFAARTATDQARGGDGASLGASIQVVIQAGAIVVQGQGRDAGEQAAEAILERLSAATLAR